MRTLGYVLVFGPITALAGAAAWIMFDSNPGAFCISMASVGSVFIGMWILERKAR